MTALEYIESINPSLSGHSRTEQEALEELIQSHKRIRSDVIRRTKQIRDTPSWKIKMARLLGVWTM